MNNQFLGTGGNLDEIYASDLHETMDPDVLRAMKVSDNSYDPERDPSEMADDAMVFKDFLENLAYPCVEESSNPVYQLFLR